MKLLFRTCICCAWALFVAVLGACCQQGANPQASLRSTPDYGKAWVGATSGPFFTGTADVEPRGSFYIEPFYLNYRSSSGNSTTFPWKLAYGIGHRTELDLYAPFEFVGQGGNATNALEYGDTMVQGKFQICKEKDRYHFLSMPSLGVSFDLNIPTGHLQSAKPNLAGGAQTTNNTWNEQFNILVRKQFKPFELYLETSEIIEDPANVTGPYQYNNGLTNLAPGVSAYMVDGNLVSAAGALEHVLDPRHGLGYLIEVNGQRQSDRNLIWGHATAPSFSSLWISPEVEASWPAAGRFPITWGAGVTFTAMRSDYPAQLIPMFTVTLNGDLHGNR
ncbi:MAG: hypothetical protein ACP5FH_07240 [Terracidiphilus sp.]